MQRAEQTAALRRLDAVLTSAIGELARKQAPPDEEERRRAERRLAREIGLFFEEEEERIAAAVGAARREPGPLFWEAEEGLAAEAVSAAFLRAALGGVREASDDLANRYAFAVDWNRVNVPVARWARRNAAGLVRGITETTRQQTREAVARWVTAGEPLDALRRGLREALGSRRRADLVAQTETTRAYAVGNREVWRESGIVAQFRFHTAHDERVCPICEPQNRQAFDLDDDEHTPPLHPGCRCWTTDVVDREAALRRFEHEA